MIIAGDKELELKCKTRLMLQLEERLHVTDARAYWQRAAQDGNLHVLCTALLVLSDKGLKTMDDAMDYLDGYLAGGKTVAELYAALITEMNQMGFFGRKMTAKEVEELLAAPVMQLGTITDRVADRLADEMAQQALKRGGK